MSITACRSRETRRIHQKHESDQTAGGGRRRATGTQSSILLWVYYSAMILFFGVECTYVSTKMSNANLGTAIDASGMNAGGLVS